MSHTSQRSQSPANPASFISLECLILDTAFSTKFLSLLLRGCILDLPGSQVRAGTGVHPQCPPTTPGGGDKAQVNTHSSKTGRNDRANQQRVLSGWGVCYCTSVKSQKSWVLVVVHLHQKSYKNSWLCFHLQWGNVGWRKRARVGILYFLLSL